MHTDEITTFAKSYDGISENYCGTFACDKLATNFEKCIDTIERMDNKSLPCVVFNTDPSNKPGDHWLSLVKLQDLKTFFLYDSYGSIGFKRLFEHDAEYSKNSKNLSIIKKFIIGLEKMTESKSAETIHLYKITFLPRKYNQTDTSSLTPVMRGFCNMLLAYYKKYKINKITIYGIRDQLQAYNSDICGNYCFFFLYKLLHKNQNCTSSESICTINTIHTFLSENFCEGSRTGRLMNDKYIEKFTDSFITPKLDD